MCVCSLSPQLNSLLHKKVLVVLHSEVMPHLMEPRLLLDFLIDSYDTGITYVHILTLYHAYLHTHSASCVFKVLCDCFRRCGELASFEWTLHSNASVPLVSHMHAHTHTETHTHAHTHTHRDYPDFYQKLYTLLEPSVFHVKYMPRFFSLMDTFLSSTSVSKNSQSGKLSLFFY